MPRYLQNFQVDSFCFFLRVLNDSFHRQVFEVFKALNLCPEPYFVVTGKPTAV